MKPLRNDIGATPVGRIARVPNALIVPHVRRVGPTVVNAAGDHVPESMLWRLGVRRGGASVDRAAYSAPDRIAGRWLFAGDFWPHFGHYLCESLSRLWAVPMLDRPVDGIIMLDPRGRPRRSDTESGFHRDLLRRVGADLPVRVVSTPTEVEDLVVPEQGAGLGDLAEGLPVFRDFIRDRLRRGVEPAPHDKVYISRMGYNLRRGGHFAEALLAEHLADEGYYLFSPERASFEEQVAVYMGARQIVSADSTPLHLAAYVGRRDLRVAIVLRRLDGARDIAPQLAAYLDHPPLVIDAITHVHLRRDSYNRNWAQFAEVDMPQLGHALARDGFVNAPDAWRAIGPRRRGRTMAYYERRLGCGFDSVEISAAPAKAA